MLPAATNAKRLPEIGDPSLQVEMVGGARNQRSLQLLLRAIRRAAPPHATLLVIEEMVPEGPGPDWSKMLDIHMLALIGGKQRTRTEYEALFSAAGFSFRREIETGAGISILEAV